MASLIEYHDLYKGKLENDVLPFWTDHSIDRESGGFFTCLLEDGTVYDTDKFVWLQARAVWMFSKLYNEYSPKKEWLDMALHGEDFLQKHGRDQAGHWYFTLDKSGAPLIAPYNIFSDCFACIAFGQLHVATRDPAHKEIALSTFDHILARQSNPKGQFEKSVSGGRQLKSFALPMILCNLTLEIEKLLSPELVNETIGRCVDQILNDFYRPDIGLILEYVNADGTMSDTMDGRLVNPGHAIEATWFLMDIGSKLDDTDLIHHAKDICLGMLDYGWDSEHGGIFYFLDRLGHPMQQLEWDQKLWWVHIEALIATIKGYRLTRDERCLAWFERLHDYSWSHFNDPSHGEWYGYLKRDGTPLNTSKGGKWKGCFHVPRGLLICMNELSQINRSEV